MSTHLSILCPSLGSALENPDDSIFEQKGSWQEIFCLGNDLPCAALWANTKTPIESTSTWSCLELVHLHATRDHLVLIDPRILEVDAAEELALRLSVQDILQEFLPGPSIFTKNRWLISSELLKSVKTSSPALAAGRNIDIWMPRDTSQTGLAKKWRQLQNEIQMVWHDHPVNLQRQDLGQLPINSLWLYGIGALQDIQPHPLIESITHVCSPNELIQTAAIYLQKTSTPTPPNLLLPMPDGHHLIDFYQQTSTQEWQVFWEQLLLGIKQEKLTQVQLLQSKHGNFYSTQIDKKLFNTSLIQRIFSPKKSHQTQYPSWSEFSQQAIWHPYKTVPHEQ